MYDIIRKTYVLRRVTILPTEWGDLFPIFQEELMNTNQLRYFVTAAECRSFTKAADQFYITQTAITQQIHALEDSLGVPLFDRSSRPISLTPAGSAFLK